MMRVQDGLLNWSLPIGTVAGISIRLHWTLILLMIFESAQVLSNAGTPMWLLPLFIGIPFLSVLLHEFGHSLMARLVGGDSRQIIMWMFGGLALCQVPHTWGKKFIVAAAGPMVTFVILAIAIILVGPTPGQLFIDYGQAMASNGPVLGTILAFTANINLMLFLFNLLPCYPMDGGAILRSILWPIIGQRRAVIGTIYTAYVVLIGLVIFAVSGGIIMLALLSMILFITVFQEHQAFKAGHMQYGGGGTDVYVNENTWLERRKQAKAQKARQKAAEVAAKQAKAEANRDRRLDELLDKVSREGLPALTEEERTFLRECSDEERKRHSS